MSEHTPEDLDKLFTYHAPQGDQADRYLAIRQAARVFAETVVNLAPVSRERDFAISHIESAVMWANAGIARKESGVQTVVSPEGKSFMDLPKPRKK